VIVVKVVGGITLPDTCDTIMFDLVVIVGIQKHERKSYSTGKSELLFVSDLG
jgi:hypothetical protein